MLNYIHINIVKFWIIHITIKLNENHVEKYEKKAFKIVDLYWTFEIRYCSNQKIKSDMWIQTMNTRDNFLWEK